MSAGYPPQLRRLVDFCCDGGYATGCGHHIDGHGYGANCQVPGCGCRTWRDHTFCKHREQDAAGPYVELERYRETLRDMVADSDSFPEDHPASIWMVSVAKRLRLILAGERP